MKTIPLTNSNLAALVDDEDYEKVMQYKWALSSGSCTSKIGRTTIHLHRFILNLTAENKIEVDHRDRNWLNNQKLNLRLATHSQNGINRFSVSKYGYRGITYCTKVKTFYARIKVNGKRIGLGKFETAKEAALAYNLAAIKYHGDFAQLNTVI